MLVIVIVIGSYLSKIAVCDLLIVYIELMEQK